MPKINQEEYEVLKGLDDKWKWIARNYNGALITFTSKPTKNPNLYWDSFGERMDDRLFQFIQWEDEEPYNISDLIEEYEKDYKGSWEHAIEFSEEVFGESEEKEVKKEKLIEKWESAIEAAEFYGKGKEDRLIEYMRNFVDDLNRLDEPEAKQLYEKINKLESYNDELIRDNNQLRNEIDNQEVLTQEFIDEHKQHITGHGADKNGIDQYHNAPFVSVYDLQNLLVPKREDMFNGEKPDEGEVYFAIGLGGAVKINVARTIDEAIEILTKHEASYNVSKKPVIPKFVAEVIVEHKELGYDVYDSIDLIIETNGGGLPSISNWVARNIDKYARAWLDGYTIEQEPKYRVMDGNTTLLGRINGLMLTTVEILEYYPEYTPTFEFTEQEIKDYDERYFAFAKPVEELEEC